MYSFIDFLWKEIYILGRIGLYFWGLGRSWINIKDLGSKGKYFQGADKFSFRDLGGSMHNFQGSREHIPPGGLTVGIKFDLISNLTAAK